jgi:hypothetical protein
MFVYVYVCVCVCVPCTNCTKWKEYRNGVHAFLLNKFTRSPSVRMKPGCLIILVLFLRSEWAGVIVTLYHPSNRKSFFYTFSKKTHKSKLCNSPKRSSCLECNCQEIPHFYEPCRFIISFELVSHYLLAETRIRSTASPLQTLTFILRQNVHNISLQTSIP